MLLVDETPELSIGERLWMMTALRDVMATDGEITATEQSVLDEIADQIGAQALPPDIEAADPRESVRGFALVSLYVMGWADGRYVPAEEARIKELTRSWDLPEAAYREAEKAARRQLLRGVLVVRMGAALAADAHVRRAAARLGLGANDVASVANQLIERLLATRTGSLRPPA